MSVPRLGIVLVLLTQQPNATVPVRGLRAGEWKYSARAELGKQHQDLGVRTVTVTQTAGRAGPVWVVVMTMQLEGQTFSDSVVMQSGSLQPVSRHAVVSGTDLMLITDDSMAHGLLKSGTSVTPLNVRLGPRSFLNYYALRAAFAELPLAPGWTGTASVLELGGEPVFAKLTLTVVDSAKITVPAGVIDCWQVTVKGTGIDERYWISKDQQEVVRTREPIGAEGAIMQLDLVSFTAR